MGAEPLERKLAAIFYADVAGYSRLTGEDEEGTHRALSAYLDVITASIQRHNGKVMHFAGDAVLADFATVSDALTCAAAVQQDLKRRNQDLPDERKLQFRIGVNLGEVIVDRDEIYGDGVNVAARLETLAEPGGICISEAVRSAIGKKLPLNYEFLGEQQVKNIAEPVKAYSARLKPEAMLPAPSVRKTKRPMRHVIAATVAAVVLVIAVGVITWLKPWAPPIEPASVERMAFPLPEKPSIAVLAFDNLSGDPDQEHLSDGISEGIIRELSRFPQLFVIARNSSFTYKGKPVKIQTVSEELGVRYVVEGSLQSTDDQIRVTAQLIDATTGKHLWSDRFDRERQDFFAVQDEITQTIVSTLAGRVELAERGRALSKPVERLQAYEYVQQGLAQWLKFTKETNDQARKLHEKALELDPEYAEPYVGLTWVNINNYRYNWSDEHTQEESLELAFKMAQKAVQVDPFYYRSHWVLANAYMQRGDLTQAIAEYEQALELNPNATKVLADAAEPLVYLGRAEEAVVQLKQAIRLNPYHDDWYLWSLGWAQYFAGQYEEALVSIRRMRDPPNGVRRTLAAVLVRLGRLQEARAVMSEFIENGIDMTLEELRMKRWKHQEYLDGWIDDLRTAGLPEKRPLPLPNKPSIAVLPFANMSDDPKQEYFVDGMTDDLITDLSKISGLFVIARNSTFAYKGKSPDVRQVSRELGVKYVLEGSVRRAGEQVRINAQLIDTTTGGHVWAERYDSSLTDIFALQDKVTQSIVTALAVNLTAGEQERQAGKETSSPEAYDAFLRGWAHYLLHTPDDFAKAIPYLENAIELDPSFGRAHAALAAIYREALENEWVKSLGVADTDAVGKTKRHLEKAMKDPTPLAHRIAAKVHGAGERWDDAMAEAERAIALDPNDPNGYVAMGILLVDVGRAAEGLDFIKKAMRLDPQSDYLYRLGDAQFHLEHYDEAAATLLRATKRNPDDEGNFLLLAAAYGQLGSEQEAKSAIDTFSEMRLKALKVERPYTLADVDDWAFKEPVDRERLREGLRKAGLPEGKAAPQREPLTADELRTVIPGNTSTGETVFGGGWHVYHVPDGRLLIRTFGGQTDQGTWEITEDGRYCRQWRNFGGGRKACFIYFKKGDEYEYWYSDGSRMRGKFKIRPGNPENL